MTAVTEPAATTRAPRERGAGAIGVGGLGWDVDVSLMLVTAAIAVALARAFRSWTELGPLLLVVVTAHGLSWLARRLRLGATVSILGLLVAGSVVLTLVFYRHVGWYGLPSPSVLSAAMDDMRTAFGPFQKIVAPVDALPGFTFTFAAGLWLIAMFADLAAGRADAPLQAVTPHVAVFVFSSVLLLGRHAVLCTALFVAALVLMRLAVRASRVRRDTGGVHHAGRTVWAVGVPAAAVVLLVGLSVSNLAPTERGGLVDLRAIGRGPSARVVESPLVSLDALLGDQSDAVLFTVTSKEPHYWRLTSLDIFNGRSWSASAKYQDLEGDAQIDSAWARGVDVTTDEIDVRLAALSSPWLPSAYAPVSVDAPIDLRYDDASSSVFVSDDESAEDIGYTMVSEFAEIELGALQTADRDRSGRYDDYLQLPSNFSNRAEAEAEQVTAGLGAFDSAQALERYFRSERFVYNRDVDYSGSSRPLDDFLDSGQGFCQQFATAFAAMARSVGLPARVAVGFTYGDPTAGTDSAGEPTTTWTVKGRFAHAWPEVHIGGVGWVAFEPTPRRGNPDATTYSDVPPAQSGPDGEGLGLEEQLQPTTTTTLAPGGQVVPTTLPDQEPGSATTSIPVSGTTGGGGSSRSATIVLLVVVGVVAALAAATRLRIAAVRRRRVAQRTGAAEPAERVAASWQQACRDLARVDVRPVPSETPLEFASRAARIVEVEGLVRLGRHESDRRFRARPPDEAEAARAEGISDELRDVVWSRLDRRQRLVAEMDVVGRSD